MFPATLLILAVVLIRCAIGAADETTRLALANIAPLTAIALCSGAYLPRKWALITPLAAQLLSDIGLNWLGHGQDFTWTLVLLAAYAVIASVGILVSVISKKKIAPLHLIGASIIGTLLFYVITNTVCWWQNPEYAKSLGGLIQSLTLGIPGYPPTYLFLFKSLSADLLFTGIIAHLITRSAPASQPAADEEHEEQATPDAEPSQA
jgi:hypothetical protein